MSKYYEESDFTCNCCDSLPDGGMNPRLIELLDNMSEQCGEKLEISCAYRCPAHNEEVGGVENSQHVLGNAADVLCPENMTVDELAELAEECGADGIGTYYDDEFVHVDVRGYEARWEG